MITVPRELLYDSAYPLEYMLCQVEDGNQEFGMLFSGCVASGQIMMEDTKRFHSIHKEVESGNTTAVIDGILCNYDWATEKWIPVGSDKPLFQFP